jgi:putative Holliday junction resolvase
MGEIGLNEETTDRRKSMRIMAIDYGDARTGVAISDESGLLAGFTTVVPSRNQEKTLEALVSLVSGHQVEELVMGFPRNMDGSEGPRAELYREFARLLEERTGMEVHLWDERRTTIEAHQILHQSGKKMKQHKKNVDAVAATLILEGYLSRRRR